MHIVIYDKHKNPIEKNSIESSLILGVHSFNQYLTQYESKKNLKILIMGEPRQVVENILWNQFFSYTLLKDIYRTISCTTQTKNIFFKINGKTYRLSEYLEWKSVRQLQKQLMKYLTLSIQCFMLDGSIKTVSLQIGGNTINSYDLTFQYQTNRNNQSISLNSFHKSRNQTFSNFSKSKQGNQINKNTATKSLFQDKQFKQKLSISSSKYSTEKKPVHRKRINIDPIQRQPHSKSKASRKSLTNTEKHDKQNQFISIKQTVQNYENKPHATQANNYSKKQQIASTLLYKKEEKLKEYRNIIEQKEKYYEEKLQKMQKNHEIEVADLKKQVQTVLANYKKKNKQLRKQNVCLVEMNEKLSISNRKLEQTLEGLSTQLKSVQNAQQKLEQENQQSAIKLQNLQTANVKLCEQLYQQRDVFKEQMNEKNQSVQNFKGKYQRLLSNIRTATDKQNMI